MGITASGIGSGLDIESLVTQLVAAEGQPAALRLSTREAGLQADLSAIGTLKSSLSSFQSAVSGLQSANNFLQKTASSSDSGRLTISANSSAVANRYQIEVTQLAEAERVRSIDFTDSSAVLGTGTLALSVGSDSFSLTIDNNNNTLAGIRDAINDAADNSGVTASLVTVDGGTRLILSSDKAGSENTIGIVATDDDTSDSNDLNRLATANLTTLQAAQDATFLLDGQTVTKSANTFSDVIDGVTISLKQAEAGVTETITIGTDNDGVASQVTQFVDAYNDTMSTITQLTSFNAETGASGTLQGDGGIRSLQNQIRQAISTPVGDGTYSTLAEMGIKTGSDGRLSIDSSVLNEVLANDFSAVSRLFTDSDTGLANRFDDLIDPYVSSGGTLNARTEGINTQINTIDSDRANLDTRLAAIEARYRSQFSALDSLVSQLNGIGSFLTTQLANLPVFTQNRSK